ncbi:unnamed protein product [Caenorhabditis brenneri]
MSNEPKTTSSSSDEDISSATSVGSDFVNIPTPTSGHFEIVIPHAETRERLEHQKTLEARLYNAEYELIAYKTELATVEQDGDVDGVHSAGKWGVFGEIWGKMA